MSDHTLVCDNVVRRFGGVVALKNVSVAVKRGEIFGLVGPNGSGKTTLVNAITGFYPPQEGTITLDGQQINGLKPFRIASMGVARTFQATSLFDKASVLDNLIVGHRLRTRSGLWDVLRGSSRLREEERVCREKARDALDFVGLSHIAHRLAGDIDYILKVQVRNARAYDRFYQSLIGEVKIHNVTALLSMEEIKATSALPIPDGTR